MKQVKVIEEFTDVLNIYDTFEGLVDHFIYTYENYISGHSKNHPFIPIYSQFIYRLKELKADVSRQVLKVIDTNAVDGYYSAVLPHNVDDFKHLEELGPFYICYSQDKKAKSNVKNTEDELPF